MTTSSLKTEIAGLKNGRTLKQLKLEDVKTYYRVQGLSSKLSQLKAKESGNFIARKHLVEYKGLIIWMMSKKANYQGNLQLKEAMEALLKKVENEKITYKTSKSIKKIVANLALTTGLNNVEANLRKRHGISVTESTYGNRVLESFESHRLRQLM